MRLEEPLDVFVVRKLILVHSEVEVMKHIPNADTINLLLFVGKAALSVITSETPVSPVPYEVSARIKVLTRQIGIYKSELPTNNTTCKFGNSLDSS